MDAEDVAAVAVAVVTVIGVDDAYDDEVVQWSQQLWRDWYQELTGLHSGGRGGGEQWAAEEVGA